MKRKQFLQTALATVITGSALAACRTTTRATRANATLPTLNWQMATSWPVALDTIFGGAKTFADRVAALTGGKFKITPRPAGELAPPLEVLNVVSQGAVPCGHTRLYQFSETALQIMK